MFSYPIGFKNWNSKTGTEVLSSLKFLKLQTYASKDFLLILLLTNEQVLYASLEDLCSALQNRASAHHKPKSVTEESTPAVKSISESSRIFQSPFIKNDDERVMNGARKLKENNAINLRDSNIEKSVSTPPKPLPRVSRALSEQIEDVYQKPVARPRTNSLAPSGTLNSGTPGPPTVSSIQVNIYKVRFLYFLQVGLVPGCKLNRIIFFTRKF